MLYAYAACYSTAWYALLRSFITLWFVFRYRSDVYAGVLQGDLSSVRVDVEQTLHWCLSHNVYYLLEDDQDSFLAKFLQVSIGTTIYRLLSPSSRLFASICNSAWFWSIRSAGRCRAAPSRSSFTCCRARSVTLWLSTAPCTMPWDLRSCSRRRFCTWLRNCGAGPGRCWVQAVVRIAGTEGGGGDQQRKLNPESFPDPGQDLGPPARARCPLFSCLRIVLLVLLKHPPWPTVPA
ncbi:hypothetical protein EON64_19620, partial [archaeon]